MKKKGMSGWDIAWVVIGALLCVFLIVLVIWCSVKIYQEYRQKRKKSMEDKPSLDLMSSSPTLSSSEVESAIPEAPKDYTWLGPEADSDYTPSPKVVPSAPFIPDVPYRANIINDSRRQEHIKDDPDFRAIFGD